MSEIMGLKVGSGNSNTARLVDIIPITSAGIHTYTIPEDGLYMFVLGVQATSVNGQTLMISSSEITNISDAASTIKGTYFVSNQTITNASTVLVAPFSSGDTVWYSNAQKGVADYGDRLQVVKLA